MNKILISLCALVLISVSASEAVPTDAVWEALPGNGTFADGLMDGYCDIEGSERWNVAIEKDSKSGTWYRLVPYNENSNYFKATGLPSSQYLYIDATNPEKVYIPDFLAWDKYPISQMVTENQWDVEQSLHGTFAQGVFSFPPKSFALFDKSWLLTNKEGKFAVALPGYELPDDGLGVVTPFCDDDAAGTSLESDTTARYFNLQGQPISAPLNGAPCICLRGSRATKILR